MCVDPLIALIATLDVIFSVNARSRIGSPTRTNSDTELLAANRKEANEQHKRKSILCNPRYNWLFIS